MAFAKHCIVLCALAALALTSADVASAQSETRATAIMFSAGDHDRADLTRVDIGIRQGMRAREGLRYLYVADALSTGGGGQELAEALDLLDQLGTDLQADPWPKQYNRASSVIDTLRENLNLVKRSDLARAMAYKGVAACALRKGAECGQILRDIYTFRMDFLPEEHGIPPQFLSEFDGALRDVQISPLHFVMIDSVPSGLEVFVDGRSKGVTPVEVDISTGLHYLTVRGFGHDKHVKELRVDGPSRQVLEPSESERALLIERERGALLDEMGSERAGQITAGMDSYLSVSQVVIGRLGAGLELELWLYDLRTKALLSSIEGQLEAGRLGEGAEALAVELYQGVDLGGALALENKETEDGDEIYEQWWFWTGIGAVVIGGTITAIALSSGSDPEVPEGTLRLTPRLD